MAIPCLLHYDSNYTNVRWFAYSNTRTEKAWLPPLFVTFIIPFALFFGPTANHPLPSTSTYKTIFRKTLKLFTCFSQRFNFVFFFKWFLLTSRYVIIIKHRDPKFFNFRTEEIKISRLHPAFSRFLEIFLSFSTFFAIFKNWLKNNIKFGTNKICYFSTFIDKV